MTQYLADEVSMKIETKKSDLIGSNRVRMNQIYSIEPNRRRKIFSIGPNLERMSKILGQRKQKVCRQALTAPGSLSLTTKYNAPPPLD